MSEDEKPEAGHLFWPTNRPDLPEDEHIGRYGLVIVLLRDIWMLSLHDAYVLTTLLSQATEEKLDRSQSPPEAMNYEQ